jgi:hypothetical protein
MQRQVQNRPAKSAQHCVHWTSAGFAHTFGDSAPTADLASGGFVRQVPHLPVTPAVGRLAWSIEFAN